jgi:UDP-N-acetylmuramate: L-alanyl-gamma-D-glutamyl-meso-diaminopimelate ligase
MSPVNPEDYYRAKAAKLSCPEARLAERPALPEKPARVHVIGVCGTAMGSVAALLKDAGLSVTGSDSGCYPPISDLLQAKEIEAKEPAAENITNADLVVVGNVAGPTHVEAEAARLGAVPYGTVADALRLVLGGRRLLACCGTHGKTTTTAMLATVLEAAGENPGYLIGGVRRDTDDSSRLGAGRFFAVEGDEYDTAYFDKRPKFLSYAPFAALVTSVELDHLDIYEDFQDYSHAFRLLARDIPQNGALVVCSDEPEAAALAEFSSAPVARYGFGAMADCRGENLRALGDGQAFDVEWRGTKLGEIRLPASGVHNARNALGVCALAVSVGVPFGAVQKGLARFAGVKRRQEPIFEGGFAGQALVVLDDFAHHPTAVRETVSGVRARYPNHRLVACFEPRSNTSRRKVFEAPYAEALALADALVLKMPAMRHNDAAEDFIDGAAIVSAVRAAGKGAALASSADETVAATLETLRAAAAPAVVLMMSNGSWDGAREALVAALEKEKTS